MFEQIDVLDRRGAGLGLEADDMVELQREEFERRQEVDSDCEESSDEEDEDSPFAPPKKQQFDGLEDVLNENNFDRLPNQVPASYQ